MRKVNDISTILFICFIFISGCQTKKQEPTLQVFSAASLTEVMRATSDSFSMENKPHLLLNFASSGTLARQIEMGAEADVFLSANKKWVDYLISEGKLSEENIYEIAGNALVLIRGVQLADVDLNKAIERRFVIGDPASVPVGTYVKEALEYLKLWKEDQDFLFGRDAKQVLKLVEMGEADYGIVYKTDAQHNDKVKIISEVPAEAYSPVSYYFCDMKGSKSTEVAALLRFLRSDAGKEIWEKFGFITIQ